MAITKITDVIVPELFNRYVINRTMELSAFFQSGIVVNSPEFDALASEAARTHNMPFFEDLQGESEATLEDVKMTAAKIGSDKDVSTTILRQKMWAATNLSAALAGSDGNGSPVGHVATEVDRDKQTGGGIDYLINRKAFILHPRGIAYTGAIREHVETPLRSELAKAENWKPVYEPKQLRIVAIKHKIG